MPVSVMMAELDEKMLLQFETQELEVKTDIYLLMPYSADVCYLLNCYGILAVS